MGLFKSTRKELADCVELWDHLGNGIDRASSKTDNLATSVGRLTSASATGARRGNELVDPSGRPFKAASAQGGRRGGPSAPGGSNGPPWRGNTGPSITPPPDNFTPPPPDNFKPPLGNAGTADLGPLSSQPPLSASDPRWGQDFPGWIFTGYGYRRDFPKPPVDPNAPKPGDEIPGATWNPITQRYTFDRPAGQTYLPAGAGGPVSVVNRLPPRSGAYSSTQGGNNTNAGTLTPEDAPIPPDSRGLYIGERRGDWVWSFSTYGQHWVYSPLESATSSGGSAATGTTRTPGSELGQGANTYISTGGHFNDPSAYLSNPKMASDLGKTINAGNKAIVGELRQLRREVADRNGTGMRRTGL
jgi:hypothetical protein